LVSLLFPFLLPINFSSTHKEKSPSTATSIGKLLPSVATELINPRLKSKKNT